MGRVALREGLVNEDGQPGSPAVTTIFFADLDWQLLVDCLKNAVSGINTEQVEIDGDLCVYKDGGGNVTFEGENVITSDVEAITVLTWELLQAFDEWALNSGDARGALTFSQGYGVTWTDGDATGSPEFVLLGPQKGAGLPLLANFPNAGDHGLWEDTTGGVLYQYANVGGSLVKLTYA